MCVFSAAWWKGVQGSGVACASHEVPVCRGRGSPEDDAQGSTSDVLRCGGCHLAVLGEVALGADLQFVLVDKWPAAGWSRFRSTIRQLGGAARVLWVRAAC